MYSFPPKSPTYSSLQLSFSRVCWKFFKEISFFTRELRSCSAGEVVGGGGGGGGVTITTPTKATVASIVPIPNDSFKLGFIGAGNMAESIAKGIVKSGILPASRIRTAPLDFDRRDVFSSFGVKIFEHNHQVVEDSDVVIFSVKPQVVIPPKNPAQNFELAQRLAATDPCFPYSLVMAFKWLIKFKEVVLQLKPLLAKDKLLVSVAAGVKLSNLQKWAGSSRFIRVMPNTPAAVGQAATVMSLGGTATEEDGVLIDSLFGAIGKIWRADEELFDAVTGLSGSGPAYIYLAIEALADGGVAAGLPRDLALGLASQTVLGAASMAIDTGKHPGQLKDDVTSPGGTTIAAVHELEKAGFRGVLMNAVVAAANRSREFSER